MIVTTKDGRNISQRTLAEKRSWFRNRLSQMSPEEKRAFVCVLDELDVLGHLRGDGDFDSQEELISYSQNWHALASADYDEQIVPVEEFLISDDYLGRSGKNLFPKWKSDLIELDAGKYNEIIITGSIGSGKTTFCNMGLIREFYLLCALTDPQATFGLMPDSEIVLVCFNRDHKLAREVTFGGVKRMIETSPYFNAQDIHISTSDLVHRKKNIRIIAVSARSADALGRNVFGGIIDETEFLEGSTLRSSQKLSGGKPFAEMLHASITRRMKSRYERAGSLPGKLFMSSSARDKESFTNKRIVQARNEPTMFVRDYALYDVQPPERFSKNRFWVLVGANEIKHKILTDHEYDSIGKEGRDSLYDQGCRFLHVPDNFRSDFERNLEDSIRDIGGVVTSTVSLYFQMPERIDHAVDPTLFHPLRTETWKTGDRPSVDWRAISRRVRRRVAPGVYEEVVEPRRHPHAQRHVHIDLSLGKSDPAGICIAHTVDHIDVERRMDDGTPTKETAPLIEVDLVLRIEPPPDGEIDIGAIRGLVYGFMHHGFPITRVTMDSFQSAESLQKFRQQGMKAEIFSVDKNTDGYDALKGAIYEGRLSFYDYPILLNELKALERNEAVRKIDHPESGSKDVGDSLAGVAYSLSNNLAYGTPLEVGISEHEDDSADSEWIRRTMKRSGDEAPQLASDRAGPVIFTG